VFDIQWSNLFIASPTWELPVFTASCISGPAPAGVLISEADLIFYIVGMKKVLFPTGGIQALFLQSVG
jgi:hypothetical protein